MLQKGHGHFQYKNIGMLIFKKKTDHYWLKQLMWLFLMGMNPVICVTSKMCNLSIGPYPPFCPLSHSEGNPSISHWLKTAEPLLRR